MTDIEPIVRYGMNKERLEKDFADVKVADEEITTSRVKLSKRDRNVFEISKTRANWNCIICNKEINEGSVVIGSGYIKVCLNCAENFLSDINKSFITRAEEVADVKKQLVDNKEKFEKVNMLAKIKRGSKGK